ncbi:hypothetical protein PROFUN_11144 [Planoprotostelium fungivorum]|uniref:Uncharacterized protein n=1 Tax=Planoprotostelium fungivorum TaxID=1890364 RepID=A0A2P6NAT9_9EUKA|nr:hypothetical protein PROFUN_11144 [Planoprotostelium fungivorum]
MDKLIPVINKLQDVFNVLGTDPLDLPQIVVVGSQSSGKSSVLEAIVGRDFLPRGSGIVTRRPLVLQLTHLPPSINDAESDVEWGEFNHRPNEMFHDFDKIREEIERETERTTGKNKGISDIPISLKIYSSHVLNLTLVDLPGITRVPIGDQPPDIERQIRSMVKHYIDKPNAIILAITAANTDLTNSDALQMARESDPDGIRTVGVITKIDIMDKGTNALDMLSGRVVPLKLGFIGVVNRSQQDIIKKKSIRDALVDEQNFFHQHSLYKNISGRLGTAYLSRTLNKTLIQHIRNTLPELKSKVNKMLGDAQQEMLTYGDPLYDGKVSKGAILLQIITRFCSQYNDVIDGKSPEMSTTELYGGARISYVFTDTFGRTLDSINPTEGLSTDDIRTAIRNATGPKTALFVPEQSFELLVRQQISRLEDPCQQCVELVYEELQRMVSQVENKELLRFSNLRDAVVEVVNGILAKYKVPTKDMIQNLLSIELGFINTSHPDFVGAHGAISAILERMAQQQQQQGQQPPLNVPRPTAPALPSKSTLPGSFPQNNSAAPQNIPGNVSAPVGPDGQPSFLSAFFGRPTTSVASGDAYASQNQYSQNQGNFRSNTPPPALPERPRANSREYAPSMGLDQVPVRIKPTAPPSEKETFETELIKYLLNSYFDVVRKNLKDSVPKSIMHFLVNRSKDMMQNELVSSLYKEEKFEDLLQESSVVQQRREQCRSMMDILKKAHEILNEVREFQV